MPFFIKKTEEENSSEEIIKEVRAYQQQEEINEEIKEPPKITLKVKPPQELPPGTITIKILVASIEFANFTLMPEIFNDAKKLLKETISRIEKAQIKINSNCNCAWCKEKITELEEFLKS